MNNQPIVSIIIPTFNRAGDLREILDCLLKQKTTDEFAHEILVVDNHSKDGTRKVAEELAPRFNGKLKYLFERRQGRVFALNTAIKQVAGNIIVCLDDDCIVKEDYLINIWNAFNAGGPDIGFVGGKILPFWLGGNPPDWLNEFLPGRRNPSNLDGTNEFFCGPLGILDYGDKPYMISLEAGNQDARHFYGANLSIRKSVLERLGCFNEQSVLIEDTELIRRFLYGGVKARYSPEIVVYHKIKIKNVTPKYFYNWYFLKGRIREIVDDGMLHAFDPFGINRKFIEQTRKMFKESAQIENMKDRLMLRSQAWFNFGQILKVLKGNFFKRAYKKKKLKILCVQAFIPIKILYGGELRLRRFVEFLKTKGDVDLLTLERISPNTDTEYIRRSFRNHHALDALGKLARRRHRWYYLLPWQLAQLYNPDTQKEVQRIVEENNYDMIFVSKLFPSPYVLNLPSRWHKRVVMDFDDLLSEVYKNFYEKPIIHVKNSIFLKLYELHCLLSFRRVLICAPCALSKIGPLFHHKVGIIHNVYELKSEHAGAPAADKNKLLFVGSLDYFPNIEGLKWFLREIWPSAKTVFKGLRLKVVGKARETKESIYGKLGNPVDVDIEINVESIVPYYQNCYASIVPILDGSGTRVKILESCSYRRVVMTTEKGMEGLEFKDKEEIFVFKDAPSFIGAYRQLVSDGLYSRVAGRAYETLKDRYSPGAFVDQMEMNWRKTGL